MHLFKLNWVNIQKEKSEQTVQVVHRWVSRWEGVRQTLKFGKHQEPVCKARSQAEAGPHAHPMAIPRLFRGQGPWSPPCLTFNVLPWIHHLVQAEVPRFLEDDFPQMRAP